MDANGSESPASSQMSDSSDVSRSPLEDFAAAGGASLAIVAIGIVWIFGICGWRTQTFGTGVWLFVSWFALWFFCLFTGFLAASRGTKDESGNGIGLWSGVVVGMAYGLYADRFMEWLISGVFVGVGALFIASLLGLQSQGLFSSTAMKTYGVVLSSFLVLSVLGVLKPIPWARKAAPQSAVTATASAPTETTSTNAAAANPKGKLTAFKAVVAQFKQFPDRFTPDSQRTAYNEELGKLVREFTEYPFDAKANPSIGRSIVELFEAKIEGNYTGYHFNCVDECVRNIYVESLNR